MKATDVLPLQEAATGNRIEVSTVIVQTVTVDQTVVTETVTTVTVTTEVVTQLPLVTVRTVHTGAMVDEV